MAKKECNKGHKYDSAIYGDNCPFCPSGDSTFVNDIGGTETSQNSGTSATELNNEGRTQVGRTGGQTGPTIPMGSHKKNDIPGGGTVIRPANGSNTSVANGKKLVGFLVTYDTTPLGECFHIYEGRNYVGRDLTSDICVSNDPQISGKHVSILYRSVDGKFKFKDEQSSNGTFLNNALEDEGELANFDVIKVGNTQLIFIAIPQIN